MNWFSVFYRMPATCILPLMSSAGTFRESRRSTRVPLKMVIAIESNAEGQDGLTFDTERESIICRADS